MAVCYAYHDFRGRGMVSLVCEGDWENREESYYSEITELGSRTLIRNFHWRWCVADVLLMHPEALRDDCNAPKPIQFQSRVKSILKSFRTKF